jgi:hypothetical protein
MAAAFAGCAIEPRSRSRRTHRSIEATTLLGDVGREAADADDDRHTREGRSRRG